jgi:hypothetical protein
MRRRYYDRRSYRRDSGSNNQFFAGIAALLSLYLLYCLVIWVTKLSTPDTIPFMYDSEIDNSLNKSLINWLYDKTVSLKAVVVCIFSIAGCVYIHRKLQDRNFD